MNTPAEQVDGPSEGAEVNKVFSMSDEEIIEMGPYGFAEEEVTPEEISDVDEPEEIDTEAVESGELDLPEDESDDTGSVDSDLDDDNVSDPALEADSDSDGSDDIDSDTTEEPTIDYEKEYLRVLAPFKANGKQMKVDNVDEAIALMQHGANYTKKMQALKPHLRIVKTLDKAGIQDEATINYLIDLHNKDPKAINKLVKESGIDPMEMDTEESKDYTPQQHSISEEELALSQAIDDIQDTPTYSKTIDLIGNQWDNASKQLVGKHPEILTYINEHMGNGIYEIISTELDKQRALGKLNSLNDLEAYKQVGDGIQAVGGFDHLNLGKNSQQTQVKKPTTATKRLPPKQKVEDPKLKEKRLAASPAKQAPSKKKSDLADFNPLNMSDEEFQKQFSQLL